METYTDKTLSAALEHTVERTDLLYEEDHLSVGENGLSQEMGLGSFFKKAGSALTSVLKKAAPALKEVATKALPVLTDTAKQTLPLVADELIKNLGQSTPDQGNGKTPTGGMSDIKSALLATLGNTVTQKVGEQSPELAKLLKTLQSDPKTALLLKSASEKLQQTVIKQVNGTKSVSGTQPLAKAKSLEEEELAQAQAITLAAAGAAANIASAALPVLKDVLTDEQLRNSVKAYKDMGIEGLNQVIDVGKKLSDVQLEALKKLADLPMQTLDKALDLAKKSSDIVLGGIERLSDIGTKTAKKAVGIFGEAITALQGKDLPVLETKGFMSDDTILKMMDDTGFSSKSLMEGFFGKKSSPSTAQSLPPGQRGRHTAYQRLDYKNIAQVQLSLVDGDTTVLINGRPQLVYSLRGNIAFPMELSTPKPIRQAYLRVQVKEPVSGRVLLQKSYRIQNAKSGLLPVKPEFSREQMRDIKPEQDYLLSVRLLWKNRRGEVYGTALVAPVTLMSDYLFDSIGESEEEVPFETIKTFRSLWHKVWNHTLQKNVDGLDLDCTYCLAVEAGRQKNAQMPTVARLEKDSFGRPSGGKIRSGLIISPYVLNRLLQVLGEDPPLDSAMLKAMAGDEAQEAMQYKAQSSLYLYGSKGDTLTVWSFPELHISPVTLISPETVNDNGMVTELEDHVVQFPVPVAMHFLGGIN